MARAVAAVLVAVTALMTGAAPALAHETDPRVVTVLDSVTPPLPSPVVVQVRASISEEIIAANPTATVLVVLGEHDRPFLRISRVGVLADLNSADWYRTNSPVGSGPIPATAVQGAAPRWVVVSRAASWGWFDHRLHPATVQIPAEVRARTRLSEWQIPFEYGGVRSVVRGHLDLVPVLGAFTVTADPAPGGLTLVVLAGRLPGLFLTNPQGRSVLIVGSDGKPFLRLGRDQVEVDLGSPSWLEDQRARGNEVKAVTERPRWHRIASAQSITWLEPRLRYPSDLPPNPLIAADAARWSIPVTVDGRPSAFSGVIRWTPSSVQRPGTLTPTRRTSGTATVFIVIGSLLLGAAAITGASVIKARRLPPRASRDIAS